MASKHNNIEVYTDGSASNIIEITKRVGGYGALILLDKPVKLQGACLGMTSQQAEMMAVIVALAKLEELKTKVPITINSDSAYIVNCFRYRWYEGWIRNGWLFIKNVDFWQLLLELTFDSGLKVRYNWVKGHSGIEYNEIVDGLAHRARKNLEKAIEDDRGR